MRLKTETEYRINKKGAECYRTRDWDDLKQRLNALIAKNPARAGVYTTQSRHRRKDSRGMWYDTDWSIWS